MKEFKGTRGEVEILINNEIGLLITAMNGNKSICSVWNSDTLEEEVQANANLIVNAFKVRQAINCELSELLDAMEDVLNPKYQFEECADSGHLIPYNRIIKFNQLIKKVKHNG